MPLGAKNKEAKVGVEYKAHEERIMAEAAKRSADNAKRSADKAKKIEDEKWDKIKADLYIGVPYGVSYTDVELTIDLLRVKYNLPTKK